MIFLALSLFLQQLLLAKDPFLDHQMQSPPRFTAQGIQISLTRGKGAATAAASALKCFIPRLNPSPNNKTSSSGSEETLSLSCFLFLPTP